MKKMKKMKKIAILFLIVLLIYNPLFSQSEKNVNNKLRFGLGVGFGFFYPTDVNDLIEAQNKDIIITSGFEQLIMNYSGRMSLTYKVNTRIDLSVCTEYSWAPKLLVVGDNTRYYHFDKFSTGFITKFHIPVKSGKHSIFFAPGLHYNFMKFVDYNKNVYKGNAIGARVEGGLSFNFGSFNLQPFIFYDYAKAIDKTNYDFELNYSGVQIGVDFSF